MQRLPNPYKKLPVGMETYCYSCKQYFIVRDNHPGAREEETLTGVACPHDEDTPEEEIAWTTGIILEWLLPCDFCGKDVSLSDIVPTRPEVARQMRKESMIDGPPCPRCGKGLASERALMCIHCHFKWYNCPSCDTEWERGSHLCRSCGKDIREMAKK